MKLTRQDGMSPEKYVGGVKPPRRRDTWPPHKHERFYHLLHSSGGHLSLVAELMERSVEDTRNHYKSFKRSLKNPDSKLWGHAGLRDLPEITMCRYCVKYPSFHLCTATKRGDDLKCHLTCKRTPICDSCGLVCVDDTGKAVPCKTVCKDCGQIGHANRKSKLCSNQTIKLCHTCGKTGCNARICSQPRKETSAQNVKNVLEAAHVPVPSDEAEAASLACALVKLSAQTETLQCKETATTAATNMTTTVQHVRVYSKVADFMSYCLQSDDEALAAPIPTVPYCFIRKQQQRYYYRLYKVLQAQRVDNPSVVNGYTTFISQWVPDDGAKEQLAATDALCGTKRKNEKRLCKLRGRLGDNHAKVVQKEIACSITERTLQQHQKLSAEQFTPLSTKAAAEGMPKPEEPKKPKKKQKKQINELVMLWNGNKGKEQFAPKGETAEQREQRLKDEYRHKHMEAEERRLRDSLNPALAKSSIGISPNAGDVDVDPAYPYVAKPRGGFGVQLFKAPKPQPETATEWSWELIRKRRLQREIRAGRRGAYNGIKAWSGEYSAENQKPAVRVHVQPAKIADRLEKNAKLFEKEQAAYDRDKMHYCELV